MIERPAARRPGARQLDTIAKQQPVRETGQAVVETGVGQLLLGLPALGDVADDALDRDDLAGVVTHERQL